MSDLSQLRQLLTTYFSESELRNLTFDLGLDYEMLAGPTKGDKARELLTQAWRSGRLAELVALGRVQRPHIAWPQPPPAPPADAGPTAPPDAAAPPRGAAAGANPFTYGNPISDPARLYGRQREIEQVFNRLRNAEAESSSLVGGRRIGKTSLLHTLAHPDVRRQQGMDPQRALFVYVDLQMVDAQTTPARLWQRLLTQMERACQDADLRSRLRDVVAAGNVDNFTLADLFDAIDARGLHVVLLLDEFENVTTNPNFDTGFFYGLRSLAIQHSLSLVTSSQHELIELTHSQAIRSSPFFNIFANITVRLLAEAEAQRLLQGLLQGTGITFSAEELATIRQVADGHPFFLQAAGHFLFNAYATHADAQARREAWLKAFRAEVAPHLAHYWRLATPQEQITMLALGALSRQAGAGPADVKLANLERLYPRAAQSVSRLIRLGTVAESGDQVRLFSSAFGEWIRAEIVTGNHAEPEGNQEDKAGPALADMGADRRQALQPILERVSDGYRRLLVAWLAETEDAPQTLRLLQAEVT